MYINLFMFLLNLYFFNTRVKLFTILKVLYTNTDITCIVHGGIHRVIE